MRGFTLIELLAVIVILAIILLIAVPTISNLIEGVKKNSFESSAKMMVKAADYYYLSKTVNGSIANKTFNYENGEAVGDELDFDGKKPESGTIIVRNDGKVALAIHDGIYCAKKDYDGHVIVDETEVSACVIAEGGLWTGPFTFEVTIPVGGDTFSFGAVDANLTINWGDSVEETFTHTGPDSITHDYLEGVYNVSVTGTSSHISFCNLNYTSAYSCDTNTPEYLTDILTPIPVSMGLTSAHAMFAHVTVESFTRVDFFDQASMNITDMSSMFSFAEVINHPVGNWNVGNVTNMHQMFVVARKFNQPIGNWDTSKVTNMSSMFSVAEMFNQPLENWDTSNVLTLEATFNSAYEFNQPIESWDISKVTTLSDIFSSASAFNQPLNAWDTSNITNMDFVFQAAESFNQPLNNWDTSKVTAMSDMFHGATVFNQNLSSWCVSTISSIPPYFDDYTPAWVLPHPIWGTCP